MRPQILFSRTLEKLGRTLEPCPRVWRKGGEAHSPSCLKSSVKFLQSVMICSAMSSAGVGALLVSTSLHPFTKKFWST